MSHQKQTSRDDTGFDAKRIGKVLEDYGDTVYLVALNQTRSPTDAEDISQDVFMQLLNSSATFADEQHLKAWLIRVTLNKCHDLYRHPWAKKVELMDTSDGTAPGTDLLSTPDPSDAIIKKLAENEIWQAIGTLPEQLRAIVLLRYVENYSTKEIARIFNCPSATIRTRLRRALQEMKPLLHVDWEDTHV